MSQIHFKYANQIDEGTVFRYRSQQATLPATNVQDEILGKPWESKDGFAIDEYNQDFPFKDTATTTASVYPIPSGTYTGSGLVSVLLSGLNTVGVYADHQGNYDATTKKFTIGRTSTALGLFSAMFNSGTYKDTTVAVMMGWDHAVDKEGSPEYTSAATLGNEDEILIQLTSTASVDSFVIDGHDFDSSTVIRLRGSRFTATVFKGGWNETASISLSSTIQYNSGLISVELTATSLKSVQLYYYDWAKETTKIGRLFAGTFFQPTHAQDNKISYSKRNILQRSKQTTSESGATYFDKRDPLTEYELSPPPLDEYYDAPTKTGFENMIDRVRNDQCLWISFESDLNASTVYGFFVGNNAFSRIQNTTIFSLGKMRFRTQK